MTIFARRRLQVMMDALAPILSTEKSRDIVQRLNSRKYVDQALPAEFELALLWTLAAIGHLEIEPAWWGDSKRPDAVSDAFVSGRRAVIEIAATNDNAIAGEEVMDAIAQQISAVADRAQKGAGDMLYYRFASVSGYEGGRYFRRRLAPRDHKLTSEQVTAVKTWVASVASSTSRLRLLGGGLDVEVEYTKDKQVRYHNLWSSMPPETHSLTDNPLFEHLERKSRQLRAAQLGTLRLLFLADVGSTLLRHLGSGGMEIDHSRRYVAARQIIQHFLEVQSRKVDAVVTFSPRRDLPSHGALSLFGPKASRWMIGFFGTPALPEPPEALDRIAEMLPDPHYEGYQARSLFRQGAFAPQGQGQYLGMTIKGSHLTKSFSVEFSARMLLDLLSGRISEEMFRKQLSGPSGSSNIFKIWLDMGMTISGAEMVPRSIDEDDDHLVLYFTDDPAARLLRPPASD